MLPPEGQHMLNHLSDPWQHVLYELTGSPFAVYVQEGGLHPWCSSVSCLPKSVTMLRVKSERSERGAKFPPTLRDHKVLRFDLPLDTPTTSGCIEQCSLSSE